MFAYGRSSHTTWPGSPAIRAYFLTRMHIHFVPKADIPLICVRISIGSDDAIIDGMAHDHDPHDHNQDHSHDHGSELSEMQLRVRALESILLEKGYIEPAALDELIETYEKKIGPRNGARVVAKAWVDPAFRKWLLADGTAAIGSLGYGGRSGNHLVALENTPSVHNIVVCTLCSCYPWAVLGLPPLWYKSAPYRSRTVAEPRSVLREFGVELPDDTEIRVWDSTAELRYLVIPMRPEGHR